jgi:glycine/D-amino acid oxidase-like deaminating enzyme
MEPNRTQAPAEKLNDDVGPGPESSTDATLAPTTDSAEAPTRETWPDSDRLSRREFVASVAAVPAALRLGGLLAPFERLTTSRPGARSRADHVVVVGAGAFGGWTALTLLRAGMRVTLVDAWGAGNSRASSGGETRVIRAVYNGVPIYSEMAARALVLWREAEKQWKHQVFFRTGALWMGAPDDSYARRSIEPMKAVGLSVEEITPKEAARHYPQMGFDDVRTVFFEPEAGLITARAACELVRETFVREGGEYRQAWVRPGSTAAGRLTGLSSPDGTTITGDRFVFACGPWMGQVLPDVIGRRIVATRQEAFFFGTPAGDTRYDSSVLPVWVHLGERLMYGLPGHERRGLKVADDTTGEEVDPTALDRSPGAAALARARATLARRFPALAGAPLIESRVCQYESSSDGHYLLDRHPQLENVWLLGGGSGHGFKMGPAIGEHVAALMQGKAKVHPLFAYGRLKPRGGGGSG